MPIKLDATVVFMGTPEFAVPSLAALVESGATVSAVVTQSDKPKGRGHALSAPPVKEYALGRGIKVLQPIKLKDEAFISELRAMNPDFLVVVAYGRILTNEILAIPKIAPVNVHASLLPKYRGASPIAWAIIGGETETGVTTMIITEKLDEGDILLQEKIGISESDTTESLSRKLSFTGAGLLIKTLAGMKDGSVGPVPQSGESNYIPQLCKEDGRVDWSKSATEIFNFVRGMHPWPGAFTRVEGETITLLKVTPTEGKGTPGKIERLTKDSLVIGSGEGLVKIVEVKPKGKRAMSAEAFIQGRKLKAGMHLS